MHWCYKQLFVASEAFKSLIVPFTTAIFLFLSFILSIDVFIILTDWSNVIYYKVKPEKQYLKKARRQLALVIVPCSHIMTPLSTFLRNKRQDISKQKVFKLSVLNSSLSSDSDRW